MLPPGHIAAGYLTAYAVTKFAGINLTQDQYTSLLVLGSFAGFAPDLDFFYAFYKVKALTIQNNQINHRYFISHAPLLWFIPALTVFVLTQSDFVKCAVVIFYLGSLSHFLLDSISGEGIMWLWPIRKKNYSLFSNQKINPVSEPNFVKFWFKFLAQYPKKLTTTFIAEILVITTALTILYNQIFNK